MSDHVQDEDGVEIFEQMVLDTDCGILIDQKAVIPCVQLITKTVSQIMEDCRDDIDRILATGDMDWEQIEEGLTHTVLSALCHYHGESLV